MKLLAEQPYIKVEQQVNGLELNRIKHQRMMYLFEHKIATKYREFPMKEVLDLSYRYIGDEGGLMYLHTSHGVYSYIVKSSPKAFVETCKQHLKNYPQ